MSNVLEICVVEQNDKSIIVLCSDSYGKTFFDFSTIGDMWDQYPTVNDLIKMVANQDCFEGIIGNDGNLDACSGICVTNFKGDDETEFFDSI